MEDIKRIPLISAFVGAFSFVAALFGIFQASNEYKEIALIISLFLASATSMFFGEYYKKFKSADAKLKEEIKYSKQQNLLLEATSKELGLFDENFNELMDITKQVVTNMVQTTAVP